MGVKVIKITSEAYEALKREKERRKTSFSEALLQIIKEREELEQGSIRGLLGWFKGRMKKWKFLSSS